MIHSKLRVKFKVPTFLSPCEEPVSGRSIGSRTPRGSQWTSGLKIRSYDNDQGFRTLAWEAANEKARDLGWVKSSDELHEDVKRAGGAP